MGKVTFQLHAPVAKKVFLAGDFTQWETDAKRMTRKRGEDGIFSTTVNLIPGTYEYKFIVDGEWKEDPGTGHRAYNQYGTQNSVIVVS